MMKLFCTLWLSTLILFLLCGCDFGKSAIFSLTNGQSEAEVIEALGEPTGKMQANNELMLLYNGGTIRLVDGKTVGLDAEVKETFAEAEKDRGPWTARLTKWLPKSRPKGGPKQKKNRSKPRSFVLKDKEGRSIDHSSLLVPGRVTVVDFYATWCGPCKQIDPILRGMADSDPEVVLRKVDIGDWGSRVTKQYDISSVPNVRVFDRSGRLVAPPSSNPDAIQRSIDLARKQ